MYEFNREMKTKTRKTSTKCHDNSYYVCIYLSFSVFRLSILKFYIYLPTNVSFVQLVCARMDFPVLSTAVRSKLP